MKFREIELWENPSGRCPVADYLTETTRKRKERARIMQALELVENTRMVPSAILKKLKGRDGLWEIRVDHHRLLGFFPTGSLFVLVSAFDKKTNKTPLNEIHVAEGRKQVYESIQAKQP